MRTSDFDYELPPGYIAQQPARPRDHSRLMVLDRLTGIIDHRRFYELPGLLREGDTLVLNETRVLPARLFARKHPDGGRVELLLLKRIDPRTWQIMVGGKGVFPGREIELENGTRGVVLEDLGGPRRVIQFKSPIDNLLEDFGQVPLPPYITEPLTDPDSYQTIFSKIPGSSAAPTAGLHFTHQVFEGLKKRQVDTAFVTLHIGLDTFAPVREEDPSKHPIHSEWCSLSSQTARLLKATRARGGRVIAVGTTAVRTLETAASNADQATVEAFEGPTDLFILPGYSFKIVDAMITNFHLPRSTLLMLVSAFAGLENILGAYEQAKQTGYRFYSFGDAMLIE
ncbi:MAG: tRNA preQ1(34) S-adenosylmethionine ribosyltransferase-isomerase QueA [Anaerolineales bacterium]|nr:tRNA preQ1(34) S-adenosylmethionine ribosyltransferase-isomerase QueA [Anaerolineales bacterium]